MPNQDFYSSIQRSELGKTAPLLMQFLLDCLGQSDAFGGFFGDAIQQWTKDDKDRFNHLLESWLHLQRDQIREVGKTLAEVASMVDLEDPDIEERIKSQLYLSLVKKCFRDWSATESERKRIFIRNLLVNATTTKVSSDEIIHQFIDWIGKYSGLHFAVIRAIHRNPGLTRLGIWRKVHGGEVREDSAAADLYRLVIYDLSTGRILHQHRERTVGGQFLKQGAGERRQISPYMTSVFDDVKQYELTDLGKQFAHYIMHEPLRLGLATPAEQERITKERKKAPVTEL